MSRPEPMYKTVKPRKNAVAAIDKTSNKRKRVVINFSNKITKLHFLFLFSYWPN